VNLADLREAIRVRTGYPDRGDAGDKRINNILNQCLRKLWGEVPDALLREEYRFALEKPIDLTVSVDTTNPVSRTLSSTAATSLFPEKTTTVVARWIELQDANGYWLQRRIVEASISSTSYFYLDKPVLSSDFTDHTAVSAKIYTKEYPYPADVQQIRDVVLNPESNPRQLLRSRFGPEIRRAKLGLGWQDAGSIQFYSRGDFFQLPAPNYTPSAVLAEKEQAGVSYRWGYDSAGAEQTEYGLAGTFSYKVCHVWGDWPERLDVASFSGRISAGRIRSPFYISSPSKASSQISVVWGGTATKVEFPNIEYLYGHGHDTSDPAYKKHAIKKFVFRARHASEDSAVSGSLHGDVPADGVYYLWKEVAGETTATYDRGDSDPVAIGYSLKDFTGHHHIRFDKRPNVGDHVLVSCIRRPTLMDKDTDAPRIPPECYNALIELACSVLVGDRDGNVKRKSLYYDAYLMELAEMKRIYTFSGHERPSFGDGMSSSSRYRNPNYPVEEA